MAVIMAVRVVMVVVMAAVPGPLVASAHLIDPI